MLGPCALKCPMPAAIDLMRVRPTRAAPAARLAGRARRRPIPRLDRVPRALLLCPRRAMRFIFGAVRALQALLHAVGGR